MKKIFLLTVATLLCFYCFSQNLMKNNWCFGDSVGLNFDTEPPTAYKSSINSHEASASISDSLGNLLFYTNGQKIWNKSDEVMLNGDSVNIGLLVGSDPSSITQGVIIIPKPESNHEFYTFQIQGEPDENYGIEYCRIDMNLDGEFGDVTEKNIDLYTEPTWEKMQAVKHANGKDWWLIVCSGYSSDTTYCFIKFLITSTSINGPYFQCFENDVPSSASGSAGQMKFNGAGNKLVLTRQQYFYLYDFDRCSGDISNLQKIHVFEDEGLLYGCEFSADGRKLYLTKEAFGVNKSQIIQYCLSCIEPIEDSKEIIYENEFEDYSFGSIQIGPDNKIYVPLAHYIYAEHFYSEINNKMSVINNPSSDGLACNFDTLTIPLIEGTKCTLTLPNMPNYNLGELEGSPCDTLGDTSDVVEQLLNKNDFILYPNPAGNYIALTSHLNNYSNTIAEIFSATGMKMKEERIISSEQIISIENLSSGVYFIDVKQNNFSMYCKSFVKE